MTAMVGRPAADRAGHIRRFVTQTVVGILTGVIALQVAIVLMSLGPLSPEALPVRLYFMVEPGGGISAFVTFAATVLSVWIARRIGGQTAAFATVTVWGLVAVFSLQVGTLCIGSLCELPAAAYFHTNGYVVAVFLTGLASLFLYPRTQVPS